MTVDPLPYRLDRTIVIRASRDTVFAFFTDSGLWASWWGAGSHIEGRPGGRMLIRHPNAVEASGEVLEVAAPERIVFTYGYSSGPAAPPGSSRVTITLEPSSEGTRLHLVHEFPSSEGRDEHQQGWRYQLAVFGNIVANHAHQNAAATVDGWLAAWSQPDKAGRDAAIAALTTPEVVVRDRFSLLSGREDLLASPRRRPALHARVDAAARRWRPALSGNSSGRLDCHKPRRRAEGARNERLRARRGRTDYFCRRVLAVRTVRTDCCVLDGYFLGPRVLTKFTMFQMSLSGMRPL